MGKLKRDLTFADLESSVMIKIERTVHSAWIKTPQLLYEAGLKQTEKIPPTAKDWKSLLLKKFDQIDWQKIVQDVEKFLERPEELSLLTKENLASLIKINEKS